MQYPGGIESKAPYLQDDLLLVVEAPVKAHFPVLNDQLPNLAPAMHRGAQSVIFAVQLTSQSLDFFGQVSLEPHNAGMRPRGSLFHAPLYPANSSAYSVEESKTRPPPHACASRRECKRIGAATHPAKGVFLGLPQSFLLMMDLSSCEGTAGTKTSSVRCLSSATYSRWWLIMAGRSEGIPISAQSELDSVSLPAGLQKNALH